MHYSSPAQHMTTTKKKICETVKKRIKERKWRKNHKSGFSSFLIFHDESFSMLLTLPSVCVMYKYEMSEEKKSCTWWQPQMTKKI